MDSIQLQRLVDGEMSFDETQRMLQAAEQDPELWKTIASSFVENQLWRNEFLGEHDLKFHFRSRSRQIKHDRSNYASVRSDSLRYLAMAASLLLAVSVGFLMNGAGGSPEMSAGDVLPEPFPSKGSFGSRTGLLCHPRSIVTCKENQSIVFDGWN